MYEVTAVYVNECESDPISVEVEVSENGIGDDFNSDIKVYPNPANNVLTVNGIEMTSIVIYNSLGQTVATIPVNGNTVNIETSSYPAGMYFIDVNTADNVVVRTKVVIAR